ncbi:hypothetical protein PspLS_07862 [Pyricularia sp. CBS 133598]|nr:hypothetical protein PspLS_07862 [Pyricularia sp. CBS 133598]
MVEILKRACAPLKGPAKPASNTILPKGHRRQPDSRSLPVPICFDHNQPFSMRDGVTIRADIYRPKDSGPVPAIIMWGPFGKSGSGPLNLASFPLRCGIPESALSGYESFEGLDPAEWVGRGYAIVNADARGSGDSEGDIRWWGRGEGEDGHDLVEAIASQPWCSGRVAFAGNSWLAIAQWFIASQRPPHLTCIAPLEGTSDLHQEQLCRGGIPDVAFCGLIAHMLPGRQQQEDTVAMFEKHPDYNNEYWQDKRAEIGQIQVPAYIGASYSTNLHTLGSFRGFEEIPHEKKWLVVHDTQEWYDLYSRERTEDLARFFDFYMKDAKNGWEETPAVRLSLLGFNVPNETLSLPHLPWRAPGAKRTKLYLDADQSLSQTAPQSAEPSVLEYQADAPTRQTGDDPGELAFTYTFPARAILAGPSTLVVHVASEQQDDMDVWAQLRKAGADGALLKSLNMPLGKLGVSSPAEVPDLCTHKHLGPIGMLRASTAGAKPAGPGDVVRLEVPIEQGGMVFEAGEKLVLKLAGHEMRLVELPMLKGAFKTTNRGKHFAAWRNGAVGPKGQFYGKGGHSGQVRSGQVRVLVTKKNYPALTTTRKTTAPVRRVVMDPTSHSSRSRAPAEAVPAEPCFTEGGAQGFGSGAAHSHPTRETLLPSSSGLSLGKCDDVAVSNNVSDDVVSGRNNIAHHLEPYAITDSEAPNGAAMSPSATFSPTTSSSLPSRQITRPRTATSTAEIDSTISRPGAVRINVKGAFIVDGSQTPATPSGNCNGNGLLTGRSSPDHHQTQDIRLPNHTAVVSHVAIDIGGSLAKLVYFSREADSTDPGGRLNFTSFETDNIEECFSFMRRLRDEQQPLNGSVPNKLCVMATGGGAYKYYDRIREALGGEIDVLREDEMECLIIGLDFFIHEIPREVFTYSETDPMHFATPGCDDDGRQIYPYLLVNIGSGVSFLKVEGPRKYQRVGGTSLGGGTLWGLLSLLTGARSFDEMLDLASKGDNSRVDMLVGDIYGTDYGKIGLKSSTIASSFGKVFRMKRQAESAAEDCGPGSSEVGSEQGEDFTNGDGDDAEDGGGFSAADMSRSLLYAISNNIGQIAYLQSQIHKLSAIYFGGSFIRGHPQTMNTLSYAIKFWSKGASQAYFLRHEGYLGAVGAFLKRQPRNWGRRGSFEESATRRMRERGTSGSVIGAREDEDQRPVEPVMPSGATE